MSEDKVREDALAEAQGGPEEQVAHAVSEGVRQANEATGVWDPADKHAVQQSRGKGRATDLAVDVTGEYKLALHPHDPHYGKESAHMHAIWPNGNFNYEHLGGYASEADLQDKIRKIVSKRRDRFDKEYRTLQVRLKEIENDRQGAMGKYNESLKKLAVDKLKGKDKEDDSLIAAKVKVLMKDMPFEYLHEFNLEEAQAKLAKMKMGFFAFRHTISAVFSRDDYLRANHPVHHLEDRVFVKVFETKADMEAENKKLRVVGHTSGDEAITRTYNTPLTTRRFDGNTPPQSVYQRWSLI